MQNQINHLNIVVGSGGIAQALVVEIIKKGERVLMLSRRSPKIEGVVHRYLDLEDENSIAAAFVDLTDSVSKVIVCTGLLHGQSSWGPERQWADLDPEILIKYFKVNTIGPALVAKYAMPILPKNEPSVFCAFSARVSSVSDNRLGGWYGYRSSKTALNMIIKNLAIEARRKRPNCIVAGYHPGTVNTKLSKPFQRGVKPEKLFSPEFAAQSCLKVIDKLQISDSGNLLDWQGLTIEP